MRWSRAFLPVLKESPADAQIVSHKLMLRAGLVRQTAAGIYIRAAGEVVAPPAKVEEMYHPDRFGLSEALPVKSTAL